MAARPDDQRQRIRRFQCNQADGLDHSSPWGSDRWIGHPYLSSVLQFLYDWRLSASVAVHAILKWFGDKVPSSKPGEQKSRASRAESGWTKCPRPVKSPRGRDRRYFWNGVGRPIDVTLLPRDHAGRPTIFQHPRLVEISGQ